MGPNDPSKPSTAQTQPQGRPGVPTQPLTETQVRAVAAVTPIGDSRFAPGALLAGRYRMVARIGKGGMGEVYRADDLKLGQSVALKFLPPALMADPKWLRRFHDEERIARDISHPNVCRTYDIAEIEGEHFISMEYVDGEDLSSLLKRIGRLPKDKAIQIARQLCAGLAAAHDKGVLHRDLKPANVMLDGRGHVRITDFGIAAVADQLHAHDANAGTPLYMAPEQLEGREVTVRSDIYSLGLLLYEIFTGREPFNADSLQELRRLRQSATPTTPSSIVDDMDPVVERVIMRCLAVEPHDRPASAIAVASALPGGDPLAMALAAGETPSPEMVAHAGDSGALRPGWAMAGLAAALLLLWIANFIQDRVGIMRLLPLDRPLEVLVDRATDIRKKLGESEAPADQFAWLNVDWEIQKYLGNLPGDKYPVDQLKSGRLSPVRCVVRTSTHAMVPQNSGGRLGLDDPPFNQTGMTLLATDVRGRLIEFRTLPIEYDSGAIAATQPDSAPTAFDWATLFAAAELDMEKFQRVPGIWIPRVPFDQYAAWTGAFPEHADLPIRIEAAALRGKPVWFRIHGPWSEPPSEVSQETTIDSISSILFPGLFVGLPFCAALLAWRNVRAGRGDRRGAFRLAMFLLFVGLGQWLFLAHFAGSRQFMDMVSLGFASNLAGAITGWILYLALEPVARRHWPQSIISWTRLLSGRWRDPLVGRHVLQGVIAGSAVALCADIPTYVSRAMHSPQFHPQFKSLDPLQGLSSAIGMLFNQMGAPMLILGVFALILLLRIVLRRLWLAVAVVALILLFVTVITELGAARINWFTVVGGLGLSAGMLFCIVRLGLLASAVMFMTMVMCWTFPFTTDFSRWYAGLASMGLVAVAMLAGGGFWISLAGQPLFEDEMQR